ncbi:MAG: RNA polymerase-binding protein RbpA [Actinomycetota bacterium]|nr:RNA polymerase-binding protein RbpA [Actinomycetota bacterium]
MSEQTSYSRYPSRSEYSQSEAPDAPSRAVSYWCAHGHHTWLVLAATVKDNPRRWDCRCGLPAGQETTATANRTGVLWSAATAREIVTEIAQGR